jgi:putative PIN family toxin of toxin-antitoxin system
MIRAVLDVNVLVSAVLGPLGHPRLIVFAWEQERFSSVTSEGVIAEVEAKLRLPRIARRYRLTEQDIRPMVALFRTQAELVTVAAEECAAVTGDPEDDYVLATARVGQTEYLVTGDEGLLNLRHYEGITIVSPREFVENLERTPFS